MSVVLEKVTQASGLRMAVRRVYAEEHEAVRGSFQTYDHLPEVLVFRQEDPLLSGCHPQDGVIVVPGATSFM